MRSLRRAFRETRWLDAQGLGELDDDGNWLSYEERQREPVTDILDWVVH